MAEHTLPKGTKISYSTNGGSSYTDIGELVSISPPPKMREESPDTNLEATDGVKVTTPGMKEPGETKFKCYFTKAQFATLNGFWDSGETYKYKITYPLITGESSPSIFGPWDAWVKEIAQDSIETESNDKIKAEFTLKNRSIPGFTAGS